MGRKKFWSLLYADDIVILAQTKEEMTSLIERLGKYLKKKDMMLSVEKTKIINFNKGRGRQAAEKWEYEGKEIEKVTKFKYLGYTFQKNGEETEHIRDIRRKVNIVMPQVWSIAERKFRNNFKLRMLLFDKLVGTILMYGAEIWGWTEQPTLEAIQNKYIKWTLGLEAHSPSYIILEEAKRYKIHTTTGKRAMKYEEGARKMTYKELVHNCWQRILKKEEGNEERNDWEKKRKTYYEAAGYSTMQVEILRKEEQEVIDKVIRRNEDIQLQRRRDDIRKSRYNPRYNHLLTLGLPKYMTTERQDLKIIARFRVGNEERDNRFWNPIELRRCRLCEEGPETIEHLSKNCVPDLRRAASTIQMLDDQNPDVNWMKEMKKKMKKM